MWWEGRCWDCRNDGFKNPFEFRIPDIWYPQIFYPTHLLYFPHHLLPGHKVSLRNFQMPNSTAAPNNLPSLLWNFNPPPPPGSLDNHSLILPPLPRNMNPPFPLQPIQHPPSPCLSHVLPQPPFRFEPNRCNLDNPSVEPYGFHIC